MSNKSKSKSKQPHANQSFQDLVSKANQNALKPFIQDTALNLVRQLGDQLGQRLFENLANIQNRIMAMERLLGRLGITEEELTEMSLTIEDEATGYQKVNRPVQKDDFLRVTLASKKTADPAFSHDVKREIAAVGTPSGLPEAVDAALVGMSTGETKEVDILGEVVVKVTIDRVSEKVVKPEASSESTNA